MNDQHVEDEIVDHLRARYNPVAIVLAGSRAQGSARAASDWDLFLFCGKKHGTELYTFAGHKLDLTFHTWPKPENYVFTNPYAPIYPAKILFDTSGGQLQGVLSRAKELSEKGPLLAYSVACADHVKKLTRWLDKVCTHADRPEIQFYYAGILYEAVIRVWFEQRNLWPLPPVRAFPQIQSSDKTFGFLLKNFVQAVDKSELAKDLIEHLVKKNAQ